MPRRFMTDLFDHVVLNVKQERLKNSDRGRRENWWRFGRNGAEMRQGIDGLFRLVVTARVSKHRFFCWLQAPISPDSRLLVVARPDDTTFGVLTSRIHEVWSLAQASIHGDGREGGRPTYNAKSCFETFSFPKGLTPPTRRIKNRGHRRRRVDSGEHFDKRSANGWLYGAQRCRGYRPRRQTLE